MGAEPPRKWDTGLVRPYRRAPLNFREVFVRLGWGKQINEELQANDRCIARWIEECGGEELRTARRAVTGSTAKPHRRSKRYVLGRTLAGVTTSRISE